MVSLGPTVTSPLAFMNVCLVNPDDERLPLRLAEGAVMRRGAGQAGRSSSRSGRSSTRRRGRREGRTVVLSRVVGLIAVVALVGFGVAGRAGAQDGPSAEEARYLGQADTLVTMTVASFQRVVALTDNPRINDLDWQNDFIGETAVWKAIYEQAASLDPPERLEELHAESLEAYAIYDEAAGQTRAAIEALDMNALLLAAQTVAEGNEQLQEAADLAGAMAAVAALSGGEDETDVDSASEDEDGAAEGSRVEDEGAAEGESEEPSQAEDEDAEEVEVVGVALSEFAIQMPTELAAGPARFNVSNVGSAQHGFVIEGEGIEGGLAENLGPRQSGSFELELEPGTYVVYCPVGQGTHRANGMELELTVRGGRGSS